MRSNLRTRNAVMTTPRIIVRMSMEMKGLGLGQSVGHHVGIAVTGVRRVRADYEETFTHFWRATIDWNGQDRIRPSA